MNWSCFFFCTVISKGSHCQPKRCYDVFSSHTRLQVGRLAVSISITPPWLSPTQEGEQQTDPVLEHHRRAGIASSYRSMFSIASLFLQQTPALPKHDSLPVLILSAPDCLSKAALPCLLSGQYFTWKCRTSFGLSVCSSCYLYVLFCDVPGRGMPRGDGLLIYTV